MPALLAIPAFDAVLLGLICVMMLLAFDPFRHLLSWLLSEIPVIGGAVASWVENAITGVFARLVAWMQGFVNGVTDFLTALWKPLDTLMIQIAHMFESVYFKLQDILVNTIPQAVDFVLATAAQAIDTVRAELSQAITTVYDDLSTAIAQTVSWAQGVFLQLGTEIVDVYNTLQHTISFVGNDIVSWVQTAISSSITSIYGAINDVVSWATQSFATVESAVSTALNDVTSWVATEIAALTGQIATAVNDLEKWVTQLWTTAISQPLSVIWDNIQRPANAVVQEIQTEYPDIANTLQGITSTVPLDIASALTAIGAITIPLTTFVDRCGMPLCKNLTSFGNDLSQIEGLITDGALFAFIAALAADPIGMAHDIESVLTPITDAATAAFKDMTGL